MSFPPTCFRTQSHQLNSLLISHLLCPLPWRFLLDSIPRSSIWEKFLSVPASSRHNSPLGRGCGLAASNCSPLTQASAPLTWFLLLPTSGDRTPWSFLSFYVPWCCCRIWCLDHSIPDPASCPHLSHHSPSVSFPTSSSQLPFSCTLTGTAPVVHQLCPLPSTHDLTTACTPTLNEHFGEDAHFLLGSLSMTSEPHFQLSGRHAHLTVLQTKQTQPAKFKVLTLQEFCISARLVLLKFNMHTSQLGHLLTVQILVLEGGGGAWQFEFLTSIWWIPVQGPHFE